MNVDDLDVPLTAAERKEAFDAITAELSLGQTSRTIEELTRYLKQLSVGSSWSMPILSAGTRLFRVRHMFEAPRSIAEVGMPPEGKTGIGRLNEAGASVLYLSDTPDTAIKEVRLGPGTYCLSEWQVNAPRVALVNGGISNEDLGAVIGSETRAGAEMASFDDGELRQLFRQIFALVPDHDVTLYRWSIAAGRAGGFAPICERTGRFERDGNTVFQGPYPFAGIAYTSVRSDQKRVNFAFNDLGRKYVQLRSVQWIDRHVDGSITGLDFATAWDPDGTIQWLGRPANFLLAAGKAAKLTKVDENVWSYESLDGDVPGFA